MPYFKNKYSKYSCCKSRCSTNYKTNATPVLFPAAVVCGTFAAVSRLALSYMLSAVVNTELPASVEDGPEIGPVNGLFKELVAFYSACKSICSCSLGQNSAIKY